ncbi:MAG: protein kinase domain-containing protein, partial [Vicinamibacteraceae bacterium]
MQHQIGVGTLGPIFLASDEVLHVTAAVKVFDVDATPDEVGALVQRLNAAAARLSSHPGIIKLFEAGVANHVAYLATEHAEGMSLDARLRERDAALPSESLAWLDAMADALDAIHADGADHGSLHPRDVVLTLDGPRISGCGVARAVEEVGLRAPVRLPYTAPERAAGPSWGPAADVFSLAAIAFECLAGRRPTGTGRAAAKRLPPTVSPEYDRALVDVFARGLSADAERRPASARAFVQGLLDAGAAYVYGSDAKRGAVHHRAGARPRAAVKRAAAQTAAEGAAPEGDLARFARDGVLPEASGPSRPRRQMPATADQEPAPQPEPSEASDPLTLFQPESDEPVGERPADETGGPDAKGRRRRSTNGSTTSAPDRAATAAPSSGPADLGGAADGEDAETAAALHARPAGGEADAEGAFTASGPEEDAAPTFDEEIHAEGEPFDPAQGKEDEGATSAHAEEGSDRSTSAGARGEPEGWLASTMAVPLVDAQDEVEYPSPMPDVAPGRGADPAVPADRFLDVEAPPDHGGRRPGPSELGGAIAQGGSGAAGRLTDPDEELTASLEIGPNGRNVDWPLERASSGAAVGEATVFASDADDWDEGADAPRRRRFLLPLLLLLLTAAAGAWFYAALTISPDGVPSTEQASDADPAGASRSAGETSGEGAAGSG